MLLDSFRHIIEIESLAGNIGRIQRLIEEENKRISDLEHRRKSMHSSIQELEDKIKEHSVESLEKETQKYIDEKSKLEFQLNSIKNSKEADAIEQELQFLKTKIQTNETQYFINLEKIEKWEDDIKDATTFLSGSLESLTQIKDEVALNCKKYFDEIELLNLRIQSLLNDCEPKIHKEYLAAKSKFKTKSAIAYLMDRKCSECHIQADSSLKISLENGQSIEYCPQCSRLLVPDSAKNY